MLQPSQRALFSTKAVAQYVKSAENAAAAEIDTYRREQGVTSFITSRQRSKDLIRQKKEKLHEGKAYKEMLDNVEKKAQFFNSLTQVSDKDHEYIQKLKGKISELLH